MRQRTDGALERLITPVYPNETLGDADRGLGAFTKEIVPVLNEFKKGFTTEAPAVAKAMARQTEDTERGYLV
jgi:hypothetical protein